MTSTGQFSFPPFRLDMANEQLWREDQLVPLPPKAFAILRCLVEHAGRLLTKEELRKAVWPDTRVSDGVLKGYIRDLRAVLGDSSQQPRFIETVPRRGHRFIRQVVSSQQSVVSGAEGARGWGLGAGCSAPQAPSLKSLAPNLVGRDTELTHLHNLFLKALNGKRQIAFVTGEPGIGKTTLVEAFLAETRDWRLETSPSSPQQASSPKPLAPSFWLGRGQCVEQHGAGEAYLPILEALGRIGRAADGEQFVTILHQHAPTWLAQMPGLIGTEEGEALQRHVRGATRERMLREMVEALEIVTAHRPLVLFLEDLHWADSSTVDLLAAIAQRSAPARLFVIGTYRPSDLSLNNHPLKAVKQELVAKGQCKELWLPFLSVVDVTQYLSKRYDHHQFPAGLGAAIHHRTDGNPLFVVNMVDYVEAQGVITHVNGQWQLQTPIEEVGRGVPDSVRQLLEKQVERLSEEQQRVLEVASVAGVMFRATAVAGGLEISVEQVEACCDELVKRGQFLRAQEPHPLPNGTLSACYEFHHALQHSVLYERIPSLRRVRHHRRVGDSEEQSYGERASEIAAELAVHFERGNDLQRAAHYYQHAGHNALRQHGYQEAILHFRRGLALLATFPDTAERQQQELALLVALGVPLQMTKGYAAAELADTYGRARALCQHVGEQVELILTLVGLCTFYLVRAELPTARELAEQCVRLAQNTQVPALLTTAYCTLGLALFYLGEGGAAHAALEQGSLYYHPQDHSSLTLRYGQDPGVVNKAYNALTLWVLGYPERALRELREALTLAQELSHVFSMAGCLHTVTWCHQYRREEQTVQEYAEELIRLCEKEGFSLWWAVGTIQLGWTLSEQGESDAGLARIRTGLSAFNATGAAIAQTYHLALLAETCGKNGQPQEGLRLLDEALEAASRTGERYYEAEIYRLKGELTLQQRARAWGLGAGAVSPQAPSLKPRDPIEVVEEVEGYFLKAIDIARQQQAKSLELRAVISLVRLRLQHASKPGALKTGKNAQRTGKGIHPTHHTPHARLAEAHQMLSHLYSWFTEGFDTKDLQAAKALLDVLDAPHPLPRDEKPGS